jgi:tubulin polyglutamylase TTLL5
VRDLFRLVGVDSPPPTLDSEEAVAAHYEAEQARSGGFQRIYPAADADRWLSCLTWPRRLDLLLAHHVCPAVPLDPPPLRTQKIRALPLGEELVLVSEEPGTVRAVNATAGYTWLRIEEEASTEEIAAELAERFGQPLARVRANVDAVVAQWIEAGLVDLAETSTEKSVSRTTRRFALAGLALEVTLPADVAPIAGVIAPDATGKEPLVGAVEVLPQVRGYLLRTGEGIALSCDNEDGLGPALRDLLVQRVAHRTPHSNFAIPASAVRSKSGAVLILGPNDSERSRVALACALTGMDLVCDELALLDARFSVLPHALPPSLPGTICGFEIPSFRQAKSD